MFLRSPWINIYFETQNKGKHIYTFDCQCLFKSYQLHIKSYFKNVRVLPLSIPNTHTFVSHSNPCDSQTITENGSYYFPNHEETNFVQCDAHGGCFVMPCAAGERYSLKKNMRYFGIILKRVFKYGSHRIGLIVPCATGEGKCWNEESSIKASKYC